MSTYYVRSSVSFRFAIVFVPRFLFRIFRCCRFVQLRPLNKCEREQYIHVECSSFALFILRHSKKKNKITQQTLARPPLYTSNLQFSIGNIKLNFNLTSSEQRAGKCDKIAM